MKTLATFLWIGLLLTVIALPTSCTKEFSSTPSPDASQAVLDVEGLGAGLITAAGWVGEMEDGTPVEVRALRSNPQGDMVRLIDSEVIVGDVVHYEFRARVGPGLYDEIGIHRVVRERQPDRPIRSKRSVFLYHGDYKDFEGCFLPSLQSPSTPPELNFAVHLAQNDIDVWGLDAAWTLVPEGVTDFGFMAEWGMETLVDHLEIGVEAARVVRRITGNGYRKMMLLGYSGGSPPCFAMLDRETQLPPGHRKIAGLVPVDQGLKTNDPDFESTCCSLVQMYQERIDGGQYEDYNPLPFFGVPALADPDGMSEIPGFEGLTNLQAALILGTYPFFPPVPSHFLAGIFDEDGIPIGLQYTQVPVFLEFIAVAPPTMPNAFLRDEYITNCSGYDVPWDDHISQIRVPVLYVSAGGGFGPQGSYTLDLLGSTDITRLHISTHPPEEVLLDFAHLELFLSNDAPTMVWQPIAEWIISHSQNQE